MSALSIQVPFPVFQDRDGQPLDNGYVWLGTSSLNPQTNPVVAYYDSALTIVATQPLRTINGFISRAGSPAQVYVDAVNFSVLVQDRQGTTVFSVPEGTGISPNASGVVYDPGGTGAVATTVQEALRLVARVPVYLKTANTADQNKAAFQAAISSMTRPGKLILPDGIFNVTPDIDIGTYVIGIEGGGKYATQLSFNGGTNCFIASTPMTEYVRFERFGLFATSTNYGIYGASVNHSVIKDCYFTGFQTSAIFLSGYSNDIESNDIVTNQGTGITIGGVSNNVNITKNRIFDNNGIGILLNSTNADAGLQINILENAIEDNQVAGIVALNTKGLNICGNYFERNSSVGYGYTSPVAITIQADIHLLCLNSQNLDLSLPYANKSPTIRGNHTTPNGSAGVGSKSLTAFVFTNYADNLTVENNQIFDTTMVDGIVALYRNKNNSQINNQLIISGNSRNDVTFVSNGSLTDAQYASAHLISNKSNAICQNYADGNFLGAAWNVYSGTSGTWARADLMYQTLPVWAMGDGDRLWGHSIDTTIYQELKGQWVYFGVWVNTQGSLTNARLLIDGNASSSATDFDNASAWTFKSVALQIGSAATSFWYGIQKVGTGSDLLISGPVVGVIGSDYIENKARYPVWDRLDYPAAGTWKVADRVVRTVPVVGQPKAWLCTVAGSAGTWVSEGVL